MAGIQKKNEGEQEKQELPSADLGYEIPDTSGLTKRLEDARIQNLQREHQSKEEEDEKDEKQGGERRKKRPKKTVGEICFCMNPSCRIGGFVQVEKDAE